MVECSTAHINSIFFIDSSLADEAEPQPIDDGDLHFLKQNMNTCSEKAKINMPDSAAVSSSLTIQYITKCIEITSTQVTSQLT